jgi:DNA-binding transcriptional ArsR family regulator
MAEQHLRALGCRERLTILRALLAGERTARELADELEAAPFNVGNHLRVLRRLGIVTAIPGSDGRFPKYGIAPAVNLSEGRLNLGWAVFSFHKDPKPLPDAAKAMGEMRDSLRASRKT